MRYLRYILLFAAGVFSPRINAQPLAERWVPAPYTPYSFIRGDQNVIAGNRLDSFLYKLVQLRHTRKGRISIVHIGDSHLQADGITSVVRNGCQEYFGDAGRGLIFPYQLANSNAPHDIRSTSRNSWKSNRITNPEKPIKTGISGYGIHSGDKNATINIQLNEFGGRRDSFDRMVFFLCNDSVCYKITDSNLATPILLNTSHNDMAQSVVVNTGAMVNGFELSKVSAPENNLYSFYGVSLEKRDRPGVLYHTIGANGARYDQFLRNDLFWAQLKDLHGDLFIVSLGTNEAQNQFLNETSFIAFCDSFVSRIRGIAPHAAILLTTPAGSFFKVKTPNRSIQTVATGLNKYCRNKNLACWDLFNITGGMDGTAAWRKYDLIARDGIHYTNAGYQLQGALLLNALAGAYNNYEVSHSYKKQPATPARPNFAPAVPVHKRDTTRLEAVDPSKRKSNIVVEYSD